MSRHRPEDFPQQPATIVQPAEDDDLRGLAREASAGLTATAQAADDRLDEVADTAAKAARRGLLLALVAVSVVLIASIVLSLYTLSTALQAGQDAASIAATGELAQARQANIANARTDLEAANGALIAAGLAPVPTPPLTSSSQDITAAVGEARGALRAIGELQAKGLVIGGVRAPDPRSGEFPEIVPDRPGDN